MKLYGNSTVYKGSSVTVTAALITNDASALGSIDFLLTFNDSLFSCALSDIKMLNPTSDGDFECSFINASTIRVTWNSGAISLPVGAETNLIRFGFKAKSLGTGTFTISNPDGFSDQTLEPISVGTGDPISIKVNPPVVLSSNNNLASLEVSPGTLSPAFSAATTNYTMSVAGEVTAVTVSAPPADSKSSVSVTGNTALVDGDNPISIVVTAENGATKTYTILCNRIGPTPTPGVTVQLPGGEFTVIELPVDTPIPTGFYKTLSEMDGRQIVIYRALKGDLDLYYLLAADGTAAFYYYNSDDETYDPFVMLTLPAQPFTVIKPGKDVVVPAGFSETTIIINGQTVQAWQRPTSIAATKTAGAITAAATSVAPIETLLYLMDNRGIKGFYLYDQTAQTLALFEETAPDGTTDPTETGVTPGDQQTTGSDAWMVVSIILMVLCLGMAGVVIMLVVQGKNNDSGDGGRPAKIVAPKIQRVN